MRRHLSEQLKSLRRNGQKGFTLIELLVVISILGILAAVVTMSLVGITNLAQQRAKATELHIVQEAYDTMLADQGVDPANACPAAAQNPTNNMSAFPSSTQAPIGGIAHTVVALYPQYLRQQTTQWRYACDPSSTNGQILQS